MYDIYMKRNVLVHSFISVFPTAPFKLVDFRVRNDDVHS